MRAVDPDELTRIELPADPASVSRARRFVADALRDEVDDDLFDAAMVITSELTTNAMLHARTGFEVVIRFDETGLRLEVHDGNPRLPRRKRHSESSATGRGIVLVESLATVAGAEQTPTGKVVWAVLTPMPGEPPVVGATADKHGSNVTPLHDLPDPLAPSPGTEDLQVAARDDGPELRALAPDDASSLVLV